MKLRLTKHLVKWSGKRKNQFTSTVPPLPFKIRKNVGDDILRIPGLFKSSVSFTNQRTWSQKTRHFSSLRSFKERSKFKTLRKKLLTHRTYYKYPSFQIQWFFSVFSPIVSVPTKKSDQRRLGLEQFWCYTVLYYRVIIKKVSSYEVDISR